MPGDDYVSIVYGKDNMEGSHMAISGETDELGVMM